MAHVIQGRRSHHTHTMGKMCNNIFFVSRVCFYNCPAARFIVNSERSRKFASLQAKNTFWFWYHFCKHLLHNTIVKLIFHGLSLRVQWENATIIISLGKQWEKSVSNGTTTSQSFICGRFGQVGKLAGLSSLTDVNTCRKSLKELNSPISFCNFMGYSSTFGFASWSMLHGSCLQN